MPLLQGESCHSNYHSLCVKPHGIRLTAIIVHNVHFHDRCNVLKDFLCFIKFILVAIFHAETRQLISILIIS